MDIFDITPEELDEHVAKANAEIDDEQPPPEEPASKSFTLQHFAKGLPEHEVETFEQLANVLVVSLKKRRTRVWHIGTKLLEVKAMLPHGKFGRFYERYLGISRATASRYMNIARRWKFPADIPDEKTFTELYEDAAWSAEFGDRYYSKREAGGTRRKGNGRRYDPHATLKVLLRLKKRFMVMRQYPDRVIPADPEERAKVIGAMVDLRGQLDRFLGQLRKPAPKPLPPGATPDDYFYGDSLAAVADSQPAVCADNAVSN